MVGTIATTSWFSVFCAFHWKNDFKLKLTEKFNASIFFFSLKFALVEPNFGFESVKTNLRRIFGEEKILEIEIW